jgi:Ca-activated chloride channel family protein
MANLGRRAMPAVLAALTGAGLMIPTRILFPASEAQPPPDPADCVALTVLAAAYKDPFMVELIGRFHNMQPRLGDGRCIEVVELPARASGEAKTDLLDGRVKPDVWIPASSSWVDLVRHRSGDDIVPGEKDIEIIAHSYQVIAIPQVMAKDPLIKWPSGTIVDGRPTLGWRTLHELALRNRQEPGRFRFGKSNPEFSTSGLHATVGAFAAAKAALEAEGPLAEDETDPLTTADFDDPVRLEKLLPFVRELEESVIYYRDSSVELLPTLHRPVGFGGVPLFSAVPVQEMSVLQYNFGDEGGKAGGDPLPCPPDSPNRPPEQKLVAIYPREFTVKAKLPYVILQWVRGDKREAAEKFEAFLLSDEIAEAFRDQGFRTKQPGKECLFTQENGVLENPLDIDPPEAEVLQKVLETWARVRKAARVLILIDTSVTPLDLVNQAKQAVSDSLKYFGERDAFEVWAFPSKDPEKAFDRVAVWPDPAAGGLASVEAKIAAITPQNGASDLYKTLTDALKEAEDRSDPAVIDGIILLTDGVDEMAPRRRLNRNNVAGKIERSESRFEVLVFPVAYGESPDYETLDAFAKASRTGLACLDPTAPSGCVQSTPQSIDKVFADVVRNF